MQTRLDNVQRDFAAENFSNQTVRDRNLDPLLQGNAQFQMGEYARSDETFESLNIRMESAMRMGITGEATRAAAGAMAGNYRPWFMDDLFISYYQIWAAMATGRWADARVIINQSYAKQQRLSAEYRRLLDRRERDMAGLGAHMRGENAMWEPFADIMNPALTYLAGIYFLNFARSSADWDNAQIYFTRADGMVPGNSKIRRDLELARTRTRPENTTWIFIESGFAPRIYERRIDWPFATVDGMRMLSIATQGARRMTTARHVDGTELVADVNRMFMTEFNEYSVNEALRAAASAITQLQMQRIAADQSPLLGVA
ncbi:MAG: hypothetical protein FWC83_01580, partial [Alphaproteobacteria bacterium]|nr:hypothetical protein [Alphaproteobacteria bacterium]